MKSIDTAKAWLSDTFDAETRSKVQALIDGNPDELNEAFHKNLEFGTGGMRVLWGSVLTASTNTLWEKIPKD